MAVWCAQDNMTSIAWFAIYVPGEICGRYLWGWFNPRSDKVGKSQPCHELGCILEYLCIVSKMFPSPSFYNPWYWSQCVSSVSCVAHHFHDTCFTMSCQAVSCLLSRSCPVSFSILVMISPSLSLLMACLKNVEWLIQVLLMSLVLSWHLHYYFYLSSLF